MKQKRSLLRKLVYVLICLTIGLGFGFLIGYFAGEVMLSTAPNEGFFLMVLLLVAMLWLAVMLQTIIHEFGHLLFGLLSGYHFCSFRIGKFLWLKQDGRLRCRRYRLPGTGGQCLMSPPDLKNGKIPYVLYNLGGVFLNLLSAAAFGFLCTITGFFPPLSVFCFLLAIFGLFFALMNGIPLSATVDNDGRNAISLGKHPEALHAFWLQMKIHAELVNGVRPKDLPAEWFPMPSEMPLDNSMTAAACVFTFSRAMDQMDFALAEQIAQDLLDHADGLVEIHRMLLQAELVYCELVGANRPERLKELQDKRFRKIMKAMKHNPSILRILYTCALLDAKTSRKAKSWLKQFERAAKKHPYPAELENEWELIAHAQNVFTARTTGVDPAAIHRAAAEVPSASESCAPSAAGFATATAPASDTAQEDSVSENMLGQ